MLVSIKLYVLHIFSKFIQETGFDYFYNVTDFFLVLEFILNKNAFLLNNLMYNFCEYDDVKVVFYYLTCNF